MMIDVLSLGVIFIALLVRATLGFGDGLVAMPLLTLCLGMHYATPIVALLGLSISILIAITSWKDIDFGAASKLLLAAAVGVPIGVVLLKQLPADLLIYGLAIFLISFGIYSLFKPSAKEIKHPALAYGLGFLGGMFGGAYNIPGPPVVLYGSLRQWNPQTFRASIQGFFLVSFSLAVLSHGVAGLWNSHVLRIFLLATPILFITNFLGAYLSKRINPKVFEKFLYVSIIALGGLLLI